MRLKTDEELADEILGIDEEIRYKPHQSPVRQETCEEWMARKGYTNDTPPPAWFQKLLNLFKK